MRKRHSFRVFFTVLALSLILASAPLVGDKDAPKKLRGNNAKGWVKGSGFRLTWIHPMRGDFSEYDALEIVDMTSAIGERISEEEMEKYTAGLVQTFGGHDLFKTVRRVSELHLGGSEHAPPVSGLHDSPQAAGPGTPPPASGENSTQAEGKGSGKTMVIVPITLYYKGGSRWGRASGLGLGFSRFVARIYLYDKKTGLELGKANLSGEVTGGFFSVPFVAGDSDARQWMAKALTNRIEIRKARSDR